MPTCHRSCLWPLPHQRPGLCKPCSVERRRPQLRGTEGCGTLRGRPERPGTYTHTTEENSGWEERVHESGATVDDVAELENILKRAIVLRDIAGEDIYNSRKYQRSGWKAVELIVHNGHVWSKDLHFPRSREVHFYEGDVWHAIREATHSSPLAVWLLGGHDRKLSVDQFVLQDGRTYRTQEAHKRLQAICARSGNPELAERAFGENHAASIMAKEKNACVTHRAVRPGA